MKKHFLFSGLFAALTISIFWLSQCTGNPVVVAPPVVVPIVVAESPKAEFIPNDHYCRQIVTKQSLKRNRAVTVRGKLWPNGSIIKVKYFLGTIPQRQFFIDALAAWGAVVNLKFQTVTTGNADIRVSFNPGSGSWSTIGTDGKNVPQSQANMNLGWDDISTALHELGHAIGMAHEMASPNSSIPWNKPVVYAALAQPPNGWSKQMVDDNVFYKMTPTEADATVYDPFSIMEYPVPSSWTLDNVGIPGGKILSALDKSFMASNYPGIIPPPPPPPPSNLTLTLAQRNEMMRLLNKSKSASDSAQLLGKKLMGF